MDLPSTSGIHIQWHRSITLIWAQSDPVTLTLKFMYYLSQIKVLPPRYTRIYRPENALIVDSLSQTDSPQGRRGLQPKRPHPSGFNSQTSIQPKLF
jgi:hypothetical protein